MLSTLEDVYERICIVYLTAYTECLLAWEHVLGLRCLLSWLARFVIGHVNARFRVSYIGLNESVSDSEV